MELIADILLFGASVGAAAYCYVLAARLRRFTTLETGMGGAIAVLSAQVDDMTKALQKAQGVAGGAEQRLQDLTARAEQVSGKLELLVASLHDLPDPQSRERRAEELKSEVEPRRMRFVRRRAAGSNPWEDEA